MALQTERSRDKAQQCMQASTYDHNPLTGSPQLIRSVLERSTQVRICYPSFRGDLAFSEMIIGLL